MPLYGTCDPPPLVATYLAACGQWHALVHGRLDGEERYFFDQYGNLAGYDNGPRGGPPTVCEEYDSAFLPLERPVCDFEPNCGVPRDGDAGPPHCGDGVVDAGESCDRIPGQQTCSSATQGALNGGYVTCNADCTLNTSTCHH